jgi:hypothetical protein
VITMTRLPLRNLVATAIAVAVLAGSPLAHAAVTPRTQTTAVPKGAARDRHQLGRKAHDAQRWTEAAQAWADVLDQIPENPVNRTVRMNLVLDTIDAHRAVYAQTGDIAHLRTALDVYYRYFAVFKATYNSPNIPRPVVVARFELKEEIQRAESAQRSSPPPAPAVQPDEPLPDDPPSSSDDPDATTTVAEPLEPVRFTADTSRGRDRPSSTRSDRTSTGLIIGGSATLALGLGASSMIAVGAIGGRQAREDSKDPRFTEEQRQNIDRQGRTMNTVFIAGLVATPVLVGAGAAMLGIGLHRRQSRGIASVTPRLGRGFAGVSISGRF